MMMLDWAEQDGLAASVVADPPYPPVVANPAAISPLVLIGSLRVADFVALACSALVTLFATPPRAMDPSIGLHILACVACVVGGLVAMRWSRAYTLRALRSPAYATGPALLGVLGAATSFFAVMAIGDGSVAVDASTVSLGEMVLGSVLLTRIALAFCVNGLSRSGRLNWRVAVLADQARGEELATAIESESCGFARVTNAYSLTSAQTSEVVGGSACPDSVASLLRDSRRDHFDAVIIAASAGSEKLIAATVARLGDMVADIYVAHPPGATAFTPAFDSGTIMISPQVARCVAKRPISGLCAVEKRVFDLVLAGLLLVLLSPIFIIIAASIKWESKGPVLFRQPRIGYDNQRFVVLKFRTMYHDMADINADRQTSRGDLRITKMGRFLRRFSFDELPQLLNVVFGSMSLVGPRPHAPNTKAAGLLFADAVPDYASRHRVKPGITGWAQVNGWRGETTGLEHLNRRIEHDLFYIENWSIAFDIKIMILTLLREVYSKHAF